MDNKITRRRLQDFLAYEWLVIVAIVVVCILAWELIFTMTQVKITTGQDFLFFYDTTIDTGSATKVYNLFEKEDEERTVFSYDVFRISHEGLYNEYNVLEERLSVQEGDVIITDCTEPKKDEDFLVSAKAIIDRYAVCDYYKLRDDAEAYLANLLKDGLTKETADVTNYKNLDENKIEALFRERMKGDNRYRAENQKQEGIALEKERIKDLCEELKKFKYLLTQGDEYFMWYRRYDQTIAEYGNTPEAEKTYENDPYRQRGIRPYGLKVEALNGRGENSPSRYFKKLNADTAKDVVILVFDLIQYQPHLQFESIAFINAVVDGCSNVYDRM